MNDASKQEVELHGDVNQQIAACNVELGAR